MYADKHTTKAGSASGESIYTEIVDLSAKNGRIHCRLGGGQGRLAKSKSITLFISLTPEPTLPASIIV